MNQSHVIEAPRFDFWTLRCRQMDGIHTTSSQIPHYWPATCRRKPELGRKKAPCTRRCLLSGPFHARKMPCFFRLYKRHDYELSEGVRSDSVAKSSPNGRPALREASRSSAVSLVFAPSISSPPVSPLNCAAVPSTVFANHVKCFAPFATPGCLHKVPSLLGSVLSSHLLV